ncbi:MAG: phenylalanine--tRNA ligase subunit beta, partial [Rickettsiales bacterium]|nr:phenylalanine--tRNA ligase subunit beta [Rickettsiales bacterium]
AIPGVTIPATGEKLRIGKIRGVESMGMMCAEDELKLGSNHAGIIELPADIAAQSSSGDLALPVLEKVYNLDAIFDGEITPNRGDYLGINGIAYDLAAAGLGTIINDKIDAPESEIKNPITVKISDEKLSSVFAGIYIEGVKNCESPKWLKDFLISVGLTPINAIVDISNFICYDINRPLHMFDADKIDDKILTVRTAKSDEKIATLDNKTYNLSDTDIVVASGEKAQYLESIAGVIGGIKSSISDDTENIFIESALFSAPSIRSTSSRLKIITDSKYRFERFVSPASVLQGLNLAAKLITEICGGKISDITIAGKIPENKNKIVYPIAEFEKKIGIKIDTEIMQNILTRLGCVCELQDDFLNIITPDHRGDLKEIHDITEEIIRIYGYKNIPVIPAKKRNIIKQNLTQTQKKIAMIKRSLCANGMFETYSMMFANSAKLKTFIPADKSIVYLKNAIASDADCMRASLLPNLLDAVANNHARGFSNLAMFECGSVFDGTNPGDEHINIAGVRSGKTMEKHWSKRERDYDVFDIKKDLYAVFENNGLDMSKVTIASHAKALPEYMNPFKSGSISYGKHIIGYFGEIHPNILKKFGIKNLSVMFFEVSFIDIVENKEQTSDTTKGAFIVNNLQEITRDFSFVLNENRNASDIINCVKKSNLDLIKDVRIFDVYKNEKTLGSDKKSFALTVTILPIEKTLTDIEIDNLSQNIINEVKKRLAGILLKDFVKS